LVLGCCFEVLFASLFDGTLFDLLSHLDEALTASEVDVGCSPSALTGQIELIA
jgi:hypothetical protein